MKIKSKLQIFLILFLLPAILLAQGDFSWQKGNITKTDDHLDAEIIAEVGKNHMLYRDQLSFSSEDGDLKVTWPTTQTKKDPFTKEDVVVYGQGKHVFSLKLLPAKPATSEFSIKVNYQGCSNETCFFPTSQTFNYELSKSSTAKNISGANFNSPFSIQIATGSVPAMQRTVSKQGSKSAKTAGEPTKKVKTPGGLVDFADTLQKKGTMWVLALALLGGLLVSLTPCVYPMIPITLSIIGGRDENQSFYKGLGLSATYVAGLSLTYALLGLAAASFGSHIRSILQGTFFQAAVSIIFFLLALSMFDVFMIQAPRALRNKLSGIKKAGLLSIFFLGMVSGLMASPCVAAPLAGILAFIAATGSQFLGFFMLLFFAWGMSLPLLLIGAFSGTLNSLPKAGDWMNRVKEFYGFLLLGAALYFARPLVGDSWAELGIALLLAGFAAFLGLFSNLPEDAALSHRVFKSFAVVAIAVACAFAISATTKWGFLSLPPAKGVIQAQKDVIFWHTDYEAAGKKSRETQKPVFIDFRADWCKICRELEENVFPRPEIKVLLERMVPLKIDATQPDEKTQRILDKYQVVGLPTLVILDAEGNEIKELRMVGDVSADQLKKHLYQALE